MISERLIKTLHIQEDVRERAYLDSEGIPTVGCGRNLRDVGIAGKTYDTVEAFEADYPDGLTRELSDALLTDDLTKAEAQAQEEFAECWGDLSELRQEILTNMVFNMGIGTVRIFKSFKRHLIAGNYVAASLEMLHGSRGNLSEYTLQTKMRAVKLAVAMTTDSDEALFYVT